MYLMPKIHPTHCSHLDLQQDNASVLHKRHMNALAISTQGNAEMEKHWSQKGLRQHHSASSDSGPLPTSASFIIPLRSQESEGRPRCNLIMFGQFYLQNTSQIYLLFLHARYYCLSSVLYNVDLN